MFDRNTHYEVIHHLYPLEAHSGCMRFKPCWEMRVPSKKGKMKEVDSKPMLKEESFSLNCIYSIKFKYCDN